MSYILEALRKADAERERGAVPNLHAQGLPGGAAEDPAEASYRARWLWPALGAAAVLIGLAAWQVLSRNQPPQVVNQPSAVLLPAPATAPSRVPVPTGPAVPPAAQAPSSALPAAPAQPEAAVAPPAAPTPAPIPSPGVTKAKAELAPGDRAQAAAPATRAGKTPPKAAQAAPKSIETRPVVKAVAPPPVARLPKLNELPEELRRQVPALAVGGSVYSPQAEQRMVIVNGQVFLEGATLAPELLLEQIRPRSAVLSISGQRFELPF
ncbi:MAG: general secretion pathway protein GspB [Rubrivivax sp.]